MDQGGAEMRLQGSHDEATDSFLSKIAAVAELNTFKVIKANVPHSSTSGGTHMNVQSAFYRV